MLSYYNNLTIIFQSDGFIVRPTLKFKGYKFEGVLSGHLKSVVLIIS